MARQAVHTHATRLAVPKLVHFTRVANLPSIMQHGLYPMSEIDEIGVEPEINDNLRLDGHLDGISLSIAFPNCRMFYRLRQENPTVDWVVLSIDPSVLWMKDCAFCRHNAADNRISQQPLEQLKSVDAFRAMYEEIEGLEPREDQRLYAYDPTDVQAEVLVFDVIEPHYIIGAAFQSLDVRNAHQALLPQRQIQTYSPGRGLFASRSFVR
ncbi:TPA: DUF4433 domain-containing protein [Pseudomonas aeruginosa]|nr:DUF4433 domain-containing protein [Pseudomonas aeruginosa]HBO4702832.1 DUF4433 domain-containing protein [Pseudomonas aeruginosa]